MLSALPVRSSLSVAPLALHTPASFSAEYGDDASVNSVPQSSHSSLATVSAPVGQAYTTQSQMTPPATPNGSQEDLNHSYQHRRSQVIVFAQPDPPPVFHNFLRAYYAFLPSYSPTDSTVTLPMNEGDVILVHSIHTNGWADGTLLASGNRGWLPTNYCDAYEPEEMRNLLNALLNFWDLLRSTTVNDSEIFGNQEFMKGIIAGVRYLLERTSCLTRESTIIQRHNDLRRCRKSLLSELSSLVKSAKRLQEYQRFPDPAQNANDIIDEMILKAFKIVTKAVRFYDVIEEDRRQRAPSVAVMATVLEENSVPPTPPADNVSFEANKTANSTAAVASSPSTSSVAATASAAAAAASATKRLSNATASYNKRLSQTSTVANNRLSSSSISHRVSLAGPSPLSKPENLVSNRLTDRHDTFLSFVGSFIGRLHLQSQSHPQLALAIKQSATSGGQLLVVVDVVSGHDSLSYDILQQSRMAMCDRILELVYLARDILTHPTPEIEDVIMPHDNGRLLTAATDCVKATGECVAKTKWVIERIGDFEYEFDDSTGAFDLDLSDLDAAAAATENATAITPDTSTPQAEDTQPTDEADLRPRTSSGSFSAADSISSSSSETRHVSQPEPANDADAAAISAAILAASSTHPESTPESKNAPPSPLPMNHHTRTALSIDKPLPEVPQLASPIEDHRLSQQYTLSSSPPRSFAPNDSTMVNVAAASAMATSEAVAAETRPTLPPLPRLSMLMATDEFSSGEPSSGTENDLTSSFQSESLAVLSSGTTNTSRDSESSLVSQTSTRATTPDMMLMPKPQPSMSELSTTSTMEDGEEEVESKLLERTYASELMFNKEGQVTGGSLPALVERLTTHESTPDAVFVATFYLTFRLFCTPTSLAQALIDRFEYVGEAPHMAAPVRLRVYNVFKGWLESHWREETDHEALHLIKPFAEHRLGAVLPSAGRRLLELVQRVTTANCALVPRLVSSMGKTNTSISQFVSADAPLPAPIVTKSMQHGLANWKLGGSLPTIMDIDPLEMARQLTIRQMNIFCSILPEELLGSAWMKHNGVGAPNVKASTALSTDLSNLVADTILQYPEVKKRAGVIKQWIKIAYQCLELHNYDALMAIVCSLNSSMITRLRRTWDAVSMKRRDMFRMLQGIVDTAQNNKVLRGRLHDHVPPCLPFLGMYLTDLTFVDIGNPATKQLPGQDGMAEHGDMSNSDISNEGVHSGLTVVNFDKHTRTAKIIGELQRFQIPYRLTEVADVQDWLGEMINRVREQETPGNNMQVSYYRKSLLLEPRENQIFKSVVEAGNAAASTAAPTVKTGAVGKEQSRTDLFSWMRNGSISNAL